MTRPATLDVLVPFWGDPGLLYATVDSVRTQVDPHWRLTIVDDCYPDPTVAEHFASETDPRIRYLRNDTNLGVLGNFERCRSLAEAELMMFLGCDDLLLPGFVETVRGIHHRFPAAAVIQPGVRVIDEGGRPVLPLGDRVKRLLRPRAGGAVELRGEALAASLLRGNWLYWPSLAFRTEVVRAHPFRDFDVILDLGLVLDIVAAGETLVLDPTICFAYRRHAASASAQALLTGERLLEDRHFYQLEARRMSEQGWTRARRAAVLRWTSRLHGLTLVPAAVAAHNGQGVRNALRHALAAQSR